MVTNAKRWIFHGTGSRKKIINFNDNSDKNLELDMEGDIEDFFLILNLEEKIIKQKISKGFKRLTESFNENKNSGNSTKFIVI